MVDVVEYPLKAIERITMERNRLAAEVEAIYAKIPATYNGNLDAIFAHARGYQDLGITMAYAQHAEDSDDLSYEEQLALLIKQRDDAVAEVERLQGLLATQTATVEAARAILLALCGQSPACGDTVETLARRVAGEFAAARVAVEKWVPIHANDCAGWCIDEHAASMALEGCDCGMADEDIACRSARRAVGLEG